MAGLAGDRLAAGWDLVEHIGAVRARGRYGPLGANREGRARERCPGPAHDRTSLSLEALKLLKAYQRLDIEAIATLRLAPAVETETEAALREFVRGALEREARSLAFLDEVRATN